MTAAPAIAFFLSAVTLCSTGYAFIMREKAYENQERAATYRAAYEANEKTIGALQAELAKRDLLIAKRDSELDAIERRSTALQSQIERLTREDKHVAAWAADPVPADVLGMLKAGDGDGIRSEDPASSDGSDAGH